MRDSFARALESIRADVARYVDVEVRLGAPDEKCSGLYIVPLTIGDALDFKSSSIDHAWGMPMLVRCMMTTVPANDFAALSGGLECLNNRPVVQLEDESVQTLPADIPLSDLANIFLSMGLSYRLAIAFNARIMCDR